jgi:hypothetical protein
LVRILRSCRYRGIEGLEACESRLKRPQPHGGDSPAGVFFIPFSGDVGIAHLPDQKIQAAILFVYFFNHPLLEYDLSFARFCLRSVAALRRSAPFRSSNPAISRRRQNSLHRTHHYHLR